MEGMGMEESALEWNGMERNGRGRGGDGREGMAGRMADGGVLERQPDGHSYFGSKTKVLLCEVTFHKHLLINTYYTKDTLRDGRRMIARPPLPSPPLTTYTVMRPTNFHPINILPPCRLSL